MTTWHMICDVFQQLFGFTMKQHQKKSSSSKIQWERTAYIA